MHYLLHFESNRPIWSNEDAKATNPNENTRPYVGFIPTTPQYAAGCLIEPPVSEPNILNGTKPAATAAADPPDEPPGTALWSNGLTVFLK